jgi:hypothetical protein
LHGIRYADFRTPAMGVFALLNACYVNVITSVVIAREDGTLKRLHGTPLPLWIGHAGHERRNGSAQRPVLTGGHPVR